MSYATQPSTTASLTFVFAVLATVETTSSLRHLFLLLYSVNSFSGNLRCISKQFRGTKKLTQQLMVHINAVEHTTAVAQLRVILLSGLLSTIK